MELDVAYGNLTWEEAARLGDAAGEAPDGVAHGAGTAEPWVSRLVASFVIAIGAKTVLECGSFVGGTSVWLADALERLGGGELHLCEIDKERHDATVARMAPYQYAKNLRTHYHLGNVLQYLATTTDRYDLAWVDDCHEKPHVQRELTLLYPKMNPGGLILGHDVWGSCDLQEVFQKFGGFSVNLPRLGAAGGLGIIQIPHRASLDPTAHPVVVLP